MIVYVCSVVVVFLCFICWCLFFYVWLFEIATFCVFNVWLATIVQCLLFFLCFICWCFALSSFRCLIVYVCYALCFLFYVWLSMFVRIGLFFYVTFADSWFAVFWKLDCLWVFSVCCCFNVWFLMCAPCLLLCYVSFDDRLLVCLMSDCSWLLFVNVWLSIVCSVVVVFLCCWLFLYVSFVECLLFLLMFD